MHYFLVSFTFNIMVMWKLNQNVESLDIQYYLNDDENHLEEALCNYYEDDTILDWEDITIDAYMNALCIRIDQHKHRRLFAARDYVIDTTTDYTVNFSNDQVCAYEVTVNVLDCDKPIVAPDSKTYLAISNDSPGCVFEMRIFSDDNSNEFRAELLGEYCDEQSNRIFGHMNTGLKFTSENERMEHTFCEYIKVRANRISWDDRAYNPAQVYLCRKLANKKHERGEEDGFILQNFHAFARNVKVNFTYQGITCDEGNRDYYSSILTCRSPEFGEMHLAYTEQSPKCILEMQLTGDEDDEENPLETEVYRRYCSFQSVWN